jgi:peptidoglycan/LPS O-acetylase OafA/YrhL
MDDSSSRINKSLQYVPSLDGLRAIAVLLTILGHSSVPGFPGGGLGVDIFFVLSGYLITTLLLQELAATGTINLTHFYLRRVFRLYPAMLLLLVLYVAVIHHVHPNFYKDIAVAGFYLTDYAVSFGYRNSLLEHLWSLSVEEHFYIIWPILLIWCMRTFGQKRLVAILAAAYVLATCWKAGSLLYGVPLYQIYFRFDTRMSGLLLGSLLSACMMNQYKIRKSGTAVALSGIAFVISVYATVSMTALLWETIIAEIFTFFVIYKVMEQREWLYLRWLEDPALVYLGRISYAVYLFHFPIATFFASRGLDGIPAFELTFALSVAFAYYSYLTVECLGRFWSNKFRTREQRAHSREPKVSKNLKDSFVFLSGKDYSPAGRYFLKFFTGILLAFFLQPFVMVAVRIAMFF